MKEKDDFTKATKLASDTPIRHDLSLAAGRSFDLESNCEQFVRTLMVRKNFVSAAVWIKEQFLSPDDAVIDPHNGDGGTSISENSAFAHLVHASPESRVREKVLSLNHPVFRLLETRKIYSLGSSEAGFAEIVTEKNIKEGAFAVFALGELGLLKLFSAARTKPFSEQECNQLQIVVAKLTLSLEANLSHQKVIREISARKRAEEALRRSEERYRTLIENLQDGIAVVDLDERFLFANQAAHKIFGVPQGKLPGQSLKDFLDREQFELVQEQTKLRKRGKESRYEFKIIRPDGEQRVLQVDATPKLDSAGQLAGTFGVFHDITESRRMEKVHQLQFQIANDVHTTQGLFELFHQIRSRLSPILNTENFFIALYDKENDTFTLPFFKDEKDNFQTFPAGKTLTAYVVRNDKALLATNEDIKELEETGEVDRVGSPSKIWLGVPLKVDGEITGALVVQSYADELAYDHTDLEVLKFVSNQVGISIERKRAQEALKSSEERYRTLIENQQEGIAVIDPEERFLFANPAAHEIFGVPAGSLAGQSLLQYIDDENAAVLSAQIRLHQSGKKSQYELSILRPDGEGRILQITAMPKFDRNLKFVSTFGVFRDITERKRAEQALRESEEQLRQSQKMEAVGRLAGGIAHDLNNLLTGVTGYGDLLAAKISPDSPLRKYVDEVQKAAQRATTLIGQLLAFSRKQILQPKLMLLNDTVQGMKDMLQRILGEKVEMIISLDPDLGTVKADPGQIEQVVMNLVVNARDAMPGGGRLTIETANVVLDKKVTNKHPQVEPGSYVMLSVSDTGEGMDRETQRRVFEPFFTTKEVGKGTGLGLSTIYGVVKQSGGTIRLVSKSGHGATFKIYLPRADENASVSTPVPPEDIRDQAGETLPLVHSLAESQKSC